MPMHVHQHPVWLLDQTSRAHYRVGAEEKLGLATIVNFTPCGNGRLLAIHFRGLVARLTNTMTCCTAVSEDISADKQIEVKQDQNLHLSSKFMLQPMHTIRRPSHLSQPSYIHMYIYCTTGADGCMYSLYYTV